jgi:5-methylcytosine-specific restriction endonuclease McrA
MAYAELTLTELRSRIVELRRKESIALAQMLEYLSELDTGQGYRELGYSSLFSYCTKELKYSEASAYRRIAAARVIADHPEVLVKIRDGAMHLCAVAELAKVLTEENKAELIPAAVGASKREVEQVIVPYLPEEQPKRDRIICKKVKAAESDSQPLFPALSPVERPQNIQNACHFAFDADEEFLRLYKQAKALTGKGAIADVLKAALKKLVEVKSPVQRAKRRKLREAARAKSRTRHIPAAVRDEVFVRDEGRCTFCSADGTRCEETQRLQVDHIQPFALGGGHEAENLRLLCPAHNQLMAERVFGKEKIAACISRG